MSTENHAAELKHDLVDVRAVLDGLGLLDRATQRQAGGYIIRCPWHHEKTPSCSVQNRGGVLVAHCFACDARGDVLSLVAQVRGLDTKMDFTKVLVAAAELAHRWDIIEALEGRERAAERRRQAPPKPPPRPSPPAPERTYPPDADVLELWDAAVPVTDDAEAAAWLTSRAIPPAECAVRDLCRAVPTDARLPSWARSKAGTWPQSGHRLLVPMFDAEGKLRSFRARAVRADVTPKTLVPTGHRIGGLVMADPLARMVLETGGTPSWWTHETLRVVIAEGDPDFLVWGARAARHEPPLAVFGVESGGWSEALAARVPNGAHVAIRTHQDAAGDKYAAEVARSLAKRCKLFRPKVKA